MSAAAPPLPDERRLRLAVTGTVQGVGFRPFVQRLARGLALSGWVANSSGGAVIEVQGPAAAVQCFVETLPRQLPSQARIHQLSQEPRPLLAASGFAIRPSLADSPVSLTLPHDLAPCPDCLREFHDVHSRRHHYPFISCTACGPRWSLIRALPFDRATTSFAAFPPCAACAAEYADPADRRCHHQGISCSACGPTLRLVDGRGAVLASGAGAMALAAARLNEGEIIALKSVGGFQLLVDARSSPAITRLRHRKGRPAKPLAVMFADLDQLAHHCAVGREERQALAAPARPIVLLTGPHRLPAAIAPGLTSLGALLPPSPLHELLFHHFPHPVVATSGNPSGEPLCCDNSDALAQLGDIADCLLLHELTIRQPLDDSVVRLTGGQAVTLRAGRGLAPILLPMAIDSGGIAVGGHQKNTVAVATPQGIVASGHIGDLGSLRAQQRLSDSIARLRAFAQPGDIHWLGDPHPNYGSSQWLADNGHRATRVQHHIAHFFSVLAEHHHRGPALGVCWDGSGLGSDGKLWGGEFFLWDGQASVERVAHLRPFPLPGGEAAIREPRRQALGLLWAAQTDPPATSPRRSRPAGDWQVVPTVDLLSSESRKPDPSHPPPPPCSQLPFAQVTIPPALRTAFSDSEWHNLQTMLNKRINSPECTSAGRLIDAVAALLNVSYRNRFEADAAMQLEALAAQAPNTDEQWPFAIHHQDTCRVIDWQPMIAALLAQQHSHTTAQRAAIFHNTLAAIIAAVAEEFAAVPVFLSGGVFQNKVLTERVTHRLTAAGRTVLSHRHIPPNDGGLAVGQLYYAQHCAGDQPCA